MPVCKKCLVAKPLGDFYESNPSSCKECVKAAVKRNRTARADYYKAYDRARGQDPARKEGNRRRYYIRTATPGARTAEYARAKEWREQNRDKRHAHVVVGNAIRDGRLKPQPCERCGYSIGVQAHHEDYSRPLDVTWLCTRCHGQRHREINEERRRSAA